MATHAVVCCLATAAALACDSKQETPEAKPLTLPPKPKSDPTASGAPVARLPPSANAAPCRALSVSGSITTDIGPVENGTPLDGKSWLSLDRAESLTVKHALSGREYSLSGAGRFLPCRDGEETTLVALGRFAAAPGPGARPGASVLVATPFGVASYGDAELTVMALPESALFSSRSGELALVAARGAKLTGENPVRGPDGEARLVGRPVLEDLMAACRDAASAAHAGAEAVLDPARADAGSLGERTRDHVRLRGAARAACASAAAFVGGLADPAERTRVATELAEAEKLWKVLPSRTPKGGSKDRPGQENR